MRALALAAIVLLSGCEADPATIDTDGDRIADIDDCAPEDPTRRPGIDDDYGDGVDQNCDGVDGVDRDGDGYPGDAPEGDPARDCDDEDPSKSPGDGDGDGWSSCRGDCADDDAARYPGAWEGEFDTVDGDCDGGDAGSLAGAAYVSFLGGAGERAGEVLAAIDDLDGDGLPEVAIGAPQAGADDSERGRVYLVFGSTLAAGGTLGPEDADVTLEGDVDDDRFGSWVASAGDVDGDGRGDLVAAAPRSDLNGFGSGVVHLFSGASLAAASGTTRAGAAGEAWLGGVGGGVGVAGAGAGGDVDDDGLGDLLLGASLSDAGGADAGRAYVFLGSTIAAGPAEGGEDVGPCARLGGFSVCDADLIYTGENPDDLVGSSVAGVGDLDDDGLDDVLIGAPGSDFNTTDGGLVAVVFGDDLGAAVLAGTSTLTLSSASMFLVGSAFDARAGRTLAAGDIDGDGVPDLFAGGCRPRTGVEPGPAFLHVWSGASVAAGPQSVALAARFERDPKSGAGFCSVAPAGDLDGDGRVDVVLGDHVATRVSPTDAGAVSVFLSGGIEAGALPTVLDADHGFWGEERGDRAGWSVAGAGDVDGDGGDDLLVAASRNGEGGEDAGKVYVLRGPAGVIGE